MEKILLLKSKIGTSDEITFSKILKELDFIGHKFKWSILNFEAMGDLGEEKSIIDFEKEINISAHGKSFSWIELKELSTKLRQIIFMTLVGTKEATLLNREDIESKNYNDVDVLIDVIDGYLWRIFIKDQIFLDHFKETFVYSKN